MGCALLISHNVTQFCLYVELSLRMDQVASTCKLSGPTIAAKIITLICI